MVREKKKFVPKMDSEWINERHIFHQKRKENEEEIFKNDSVFDAEIELEMTWNGIIFDAEEEEKLKNEEEEIEEMLTFFDTVFDNSNLQKK